MRSKFTLFKHKPEPKAAEPKPSKIGTFLQNAWLDYQDAIERKYTSTSVGIPPDMLSMAANSVQAMYAYHHQVKSNREHTVSDSDAKLPSPTP